MKLCEINDQFDWDNIVNSHGGHPLQLWGWGELKSLYNWSSLRIAVELDGEVVGGAQVLLRRLPWPFRSLAYVPRGPFGDDAVREIAATKIADHIKSTLNCMYMSIEPDDESGSYKKPWSYSKKGILIPETLILDLTKSSEELLSDMTKKTRQYIRKSERDDVIIRRIASDELPQVLELYHQTAARAGFSLHEDQYYYDCAQQLGDRQLIMGALYNNQLVSFVWLAMSDTTAFELYGGMNQVGQKLRANYILKWKTILYCQKRGVTRYDMNGLLNDGVSTFKRGFARHENKLVGTVNRVYWPIRYWLWSQLLPVAKKTLRLLRR